MFIRKGTFIRIKYLFCSSILSFYGIDINKTDQAWRNDRSIEYLL